MKVKHLKQFIGYILVGCTATISHFIVMCILVESINLWPPVAATFGFITGAITGFNLNRVFVFKDKKNYHKKFIKYLIMSMTGAIVNFSIMAILISKLEINYILSQIITTVLIVIINYTTCKLWIFKGHVNA